MGHKRKNQQTRLVLSSGAQFRTPRLEGPECWILAYPGHYDGQTASRSVAQGPGTVPYVRSYLYIGASNTSLLYVPRTSQYHSKGFVRHIKAWVARSLWAVFILLTTYSAIGCVMADVDRIGTVHYSSVIFASHSSYLDLVMASSPWRDSLAPQSTQAITSMSMCVSLGSCYSHDSF